MSGTAVTGAAHLTITPNPVAFGTVAVGQTATQTFDIANTGNITLTLTKAAPPVGAFNTTTRSPRASSSRPATSSTRR